MSVIDSLVPIKKNDIGIGKPTPWPIYDAWGNLLLDAGIVIESDHQLSYLIDEGHYSQKVWSSVTSKPSAIPPPIRRTHNVAPKVAAADNKDVQMLELDSVRWQVGETLFLQVADNAAARYTVKLIGFVKNKTIMVTAPISEDGKGALVRDGQTFIVRAFPGKKAYAFTSSAVKSVYTPHPYLHLSYPKQVRCTTIRQGSRATVKVIASVTLDDPERTAAATLSDMSIGGTSGVLKSPLGKVGDTGTIKFKVRAADNDEYLVLKIVLRSVALADNGEEFRHGFEFVDISTQSKLILSAFVHQTLAEND